MAEPICPYCSNPAALVAGSVIYPHRPDLADRKFWQCAPCGAYVGCHQGTEQALGRIANAELRAAKQAAHAKFDPLWKAKMRRTGISKGHARAKAYKWLAAELGIDRNDCHIGMMDVELCQRVVAICSQYGATA